MDLGLTKSELLELIHQTVDANVSGAPELRQVRTQ